METNVEWWEITVLYSFIYYRKRIHNIYTYIHICIYTQTFKKYLSMFSQRLIYSIVYATKKWRALNIFTHVLLMTKLNSRDFSTTWKYDWHTVFLVAKSKWKHPYKLHKTKINLDPTMTIPLEYSTLTFFLQNHRSFVKCPITANHGDSLTLFLNNRTQKCCRD